MQIIGIIAEYNPFHHGHRFQIEELRKSYPAARIVAVMSGSFTQRGAPCVLDKWMRARHAVTGGADLVLELPFAFACRSAQDFARGGVSLLSRLGIVSHLAFGTEADDLAPLAEIAAQIDTDAVQRRLHDRLERGDSYAGALTSVLTKDTAVSEDMLRAPNNILAVEYLRAVQRLAPEITPVAIRRQAAQHGDPALYAGITSASSIRRTLAAAVPPWEVLRESVMPVVLNDLRAAHDSGLPQDDILLDLLRYLFLVTEHSALIEVSGIAEGIENRLVRYAAAGKYSDFLSNVSTRRYPQSRIARIIVHLLLHFTKAQAQDFDAGGAAYIRPLAFNTWGRALLREMKGRAQLPVITRTAEFLSSEERGRPETDLSPLQRMLSFDARACELRLLTGAQTAEKERRTDFIMSPQFLP